MREKREGPTKTGSLFPLGHQFPEGGGIPKESAEFRVQLARLTRGVLIMTHSDITSCLPSAVRCALWNVCAWPADRGHEVVSITRSCDIRTHRRAGRTGDQIFASGGCGCFATTWTGPCLREWLMDDQILALVWAAAGERLMDD